MVGLTGPSRHRDPVVRGLRNAVGGLALVTFKAGGTVAARIDYVAAGGVVIRASLEKRPRHVRYKAVSAVVPFRLPDGWRLEVPA